MHRSPHRPILLVAPLLALLLAFCGEPTSPEPDAGVVDQLDGGAPTDAGTSDGGDGFDAGQDAGIPTGPERLSETGLYQDIATRTLAEGVEEFVPRFELWSDGAEKKRWIQLPAGARIDNSDPDNWVFPVGTRVWKELGHDGRPIETRLLEKVREGRDGWFQMAYAWNEEGTEAYAVVDGVRDALGTEHDIPAQKGCRLCHDGVRDVVIGADTVQLSRAGRGGPLTAWAEAGRFTHPVSEYEVPGDEITQAALGYLHGNCGHCHGDGNALSSRRALRLRLKTTDVTPEVTGAYRTTIGQKPWHTMEDGSTDIVVPGEPEKSQLFTRVQIRDARTVHEMDGYQMPPACTEKQDEEGIAILRAWIESL